MAQLAASPTPKTVFSLQQDQVSPDQDFTKCNLFGYNTPVCASKEIPLVTPQSVASFLDSCLESERLRRDQKSIAKSKVSEINRLESDKVFEIEKQNKGSDIIETSRENFTKTKSKRTIESKSKEKEVDRVTGELKEQNKKGKKTENKIEAKQALDSINAVSSKPMIERDKSADLRSESEKKRIANQEEFVSKSKDSIVPKNRGSSRVEFKISRSKVDLDKEEEKAAREKIIVIDGIDKPSSFKNSQVILKEFNRFCPKIKVIAAFSLAKGGISIYLPSVEDRDKALELLSPESFGGGNKKSLTNLKDSVIYLRGLDTSIKEDVIQSSLEKISKEIKSVRRLRNSTTGKPRQLVKVTCSQAASSRIIESIILAEGYKVKVEQQRNHQVIRCYSCQAYGHIAKNCCRKPACENCSQEDCIKPCKNVPKCVNCDSDHPASYNKCPTYIKQNENIAEQYTVDEHIEPLAYKCSSETPASSDCTSRSVDTK